MPDMMLASVDRVSCCLGSDQSNPISSESRHCAFLGQYRFTFEADPVTFAIAGLGWSEFRPSCRMRSSDLAHAKSTALLVLRTNSCATDPSRQPFNLTGD
jgi:hypothetical protein